jgi:hypothetical protein
MLIALLAILGVNLSVIVAIVALVIARRRWVRRQDGAFWGAIRVQSGQLRGVGGKWRRGYGRWVRDVLVWRNAPLLLSNRLLAVDEVDETRAVSLEQVKRLGDDPAAVTLKVGAATVEVVTRQGDRGLLLAPQREAARPLAR